MREDGECERRVGEERDAPVPAPSSRTRFLFLPSTLEALLPFKISDKYTERIYSILPYQRWQRGGETCDVPVHLARLFYQSNQRVNHLVRA